MADFFLVSVGEIDALVILTDSFSMTSINLLDFPCGDNLFFPSLPSSSLLLDYKTFDT